MERSPKLADFDAALVATAHAQFCILARCWRWLTGDERSAIDRAIGECNFAIATARRPLDVSAATENCWRAITPLTNRAERRRCPTVSAGAIAPGLWLRDLDTGQWARVDDVRVSDHMEPAGRA
jgi:hypothetical protein